MTASAVYIYDGDGRLVKSILNQRVTYYPSPLFQLLVDGSSQQVSKRYSAGGQIIAARTVNGGQEGLNWLLDDHLGSAALSLNADGTPGAELRYTSFGETRASQGELPTAYRYTGQLEEPLSGLYYYNARWYDPALPLFIQPDTLVPNLNDPLDWNRYAYVRYNPVNFTDPTGHARQCADGDEGGGCGTGSTTEQIYLSFDKDHGGAYNGLFADFYAKLHEGQIAASKKDPDAEIMLLDAYSSKQQALAFVPQKKFDPIMLVDPVSISNFSQFVVGIAKDAFYSGVILLNKQKGDLFRDEIAKAFLEAGYGVKLEVVKKTPFGIRRIDIEVNDPNGKLLGGIETKTGNSRYLPSQRAKDAWLLDEGYPVNMVRDK